MTPQTTSVQTPPPHRPVAGGLRAMFGFRQTGAQWPVALRTAICVVVPALVGYLAGDPAAGLLASLGGFASLYGSGRPFLNRARLLTVIAFAQAAVVALGIWADTYPWAGVLAVTLIAVLATIFCNAFNVQPGAYQIALSCATGTAMHVRGAEPIESALLVLAGGLFACVMHLAGALTDPHGPERFAVSAAATAVAEFIEQVDDPEKADDARHRAAVAMHHSWVVLVNQQPHRKRTPRGLLRLQETSRSLQLLLSDAMRGRRKDPSAAARARRLGAQARRKSGTGNVQVTYALPLGRPSALSLLRNTVAPGSRSLLVVVRVAVAATAAGAVGAALGLSHTYWAIAATVLILSSGFDQRRTMQRGMERTAGTFVGVGLAAILMAFSPSGLLLIAMIAVVVFCTQLLVQRNYAAAAIFITCSALLMAGGNDSAAETVALIQARALDTAIGCLVAVVVFGLLSKKSPSGWLPIALSDTLNAAATTVEQFTPATVTSWEGLTARRDLQRRVIRLSEAYENGVNGFARQREESERVWPVVVATERLAYRVLAEGWRLEEMADQLGGMDARRGVTLGKPPSQGLRVLADAIRQGRTPGRTDEIPLFLSRDVGDLRRVLQR